MNETPKFIRFDCSVNLIFLVDYFPIMAFHVFTQKGTKKQHFRNLSQVRNRVRHLISTLTNYLEELQKTTLGAGAEPNSLLKLAFRAPMKGMQPPSENHDKSASIHHTVFLK